MRDAIGRVKMSPPPSSSTRSVCSVMRSLRLDPRLAGYRLLRVGVDGNTVYLQLNRQNCVELWSLHTFTPNSWNRVFSLPLKELYYAIPSCSYQRPLLYLLIVGLFKNEEIPRVSIFEIDRESGDHKEYRLDESAGLEFESVALQNAVLGCGKTNLHIYDRSMVMGPIPYWKIMLLERTFILERCDIHDNSETKCSRFPIAIDADNRIFARLKDDQTLHAYCPSEEKWKEYELSPSSDLKLTSFSARALHETYGRAGHRVGAVESVFSIYTDGPVSVVRIRRNSEQYFFRIQLDHDRLEYSLENRGSARFSDGVDLMFYALVGESSYIVIGIRSIAVAQLQPPTLAESAYWRLQLTHGKGLSMQNIRDMCHFPVDKSIIA